MLGSDPFVDLKRVTLHSSGLSGFVTPQAGDPRRQAAGRDEGRGRAEVDRKESQDSVGRPGAVAALGGARAGEHAEHDHQRVLHDAADDDELLHDTLLALIAWAII